MTLFSPTGPRFGNASAKIGAGVLALMYTALTFGAALSPTPVQAATPYYTVELAAPAAHAQSIIDGIVWQCDGTTCLGGKGNSRPVLVCKRVAQKLGEVSKFTANGEDLAAEKLADCNGK